MRIKPSEVLEPLEWGQQYDEAAAVATAPGGGDHDGVTATQELLVSMCFFARLAVIQPPCCLECAYHQRRHNENCTGWVVWRKDAKQLAHPDTLGPNIVMVPCWIAQRLTASGNIATTIG
jgi:hypothetical protein